MLYYAGLRRVELPALQYDDVGEDMIYVNKLIEGIVKKIDSTKILGSLSNKDEYSAHDKGMDSEYDHVTTERETKAVETEQPFFFERRMNPALRRRKN